MARRQRLPSWVQDKIEDDTPLRDRIDPYLSKLGEVDKLEGQLRRVKDATDPDEYNEMSKVLKARRRKIMRQRARAYGLPEEEPSNVQGYYVPAEDYRRVMRLKWVEPWMFWAVLSFVIFVWFVSKNS
ncbi:hypothetical protein QE320_gp088 [Pseudomonas phage EM]|uniref:Uncharacterized protein n=1 Tax=Pseudomonas phage EM TaxID=2936914 RepID=A0AAE9HKE9_9CAUD|nr:hypothetical protein QE320_gp088 [Pseudomonas phage EM]UPW35966.1 hypothetical protein EM_181 [Pseudomonas phage EM]